MSFVKGGVLVTKATPITFGWIVVLAVGLWGGECLQRGLWEPDEARFAYVSREAQQQGHWSVLYRYGELYAHKPPLLFWLTRVGAWVSGGHVTRFAARMPAFIGALLALWVTMRLGRLWGGDGAAGRAGLVLMTAPLFWHEAGMGRMDALLLGLQLIAVYHLFRWHRNRVLWRLLLAYPCLGLAILAKGPVGLVVPLGIYLCLTLAAKEGRHLLVRHWLWGLPLALLFPAVWLWAAWWEGAPGEYLYELVVAQSVGRLQGSGIHDKARPFYYHLWHFPLEFMPWTLFLPGAVAAVRRWTDRPRCLRMVTAWFVFVILFFSIPAGKRSLYTVAAYPAAALYLALAWPHFARLGRGWVNGTAGAATVFLAVVGVGQFVAAFWPGLPLPGWVFLPGGVVTLAGAVATGVVLRRHGMVDRWFECFAGTCVAMLLCISQFVYPAMNRVKTPAAEVTALRAACPADRPILVYRMDLEIVPFYAGRTGRRLRTAGELRDAMKELQRGVVVFNQEGWEQVGADLGGLLTVNPFRIGQKRLTWVAFDERFAP